MPSASRPPRDPHRDPVHVQHSLSSRAVHAVQQQLAVRDYTPSAVYETVPPHSYHVYHRSELPVHTPQNERIYPPTNIALSHPMALPPAPSTQYIHTHGHTLHRQNWAFPVHSQWHVAPAPPPPPPQVAHKVWLLDCKSCNNFLTNRGMKAVLLLRPHVPLYSTDALPVNCSAYSATPTLTFPSTRPSEEPLRTCECLTQTLCCHGCGNSVGYMIVIPCARCTSSISASNRATNGHRFVFHSSEVVASERHYTAREAGILSLYTDAQPPSDPLSPPSFLPTSPFSRPPPSEPSPPSPPSPASSTSSGSSLSSSSDMPPLESPTSPDAPTSPFPVPMPDTQKPAAHPLRPGDVLYWHHLARNGEIPGVVEDRRARGRRSAVPYDR